jgi:hypothetical protein
MRLTKESINIALSEPFLLLEPGHYAALRNEAIFAWARQWKNWVRDYVLAGRTLQYSVRIKALRDALYVIECRAKRVDKQVHGEFRLVAGPGETPSTRATDDGGAQ